MKINEAVSEVLKTLDGSQPAIDPVLGNSVEINYSGATINNTKTTTNIIQASTISMIFNGSGFMGFTGFGRMSDNYLFVLENANHTYSIPFYPCIKSSNEGTMNCRLGMWLDYQTGGSPFNVNYCRALGSNDVLSQTTPGQYQSDEDVNANLIQISSNYCTIKPYPVVSPNWGQWNTQHFTDENFDEDIAAAGAFINSYTSNYDHCYVCNTNSTYFSSSNILMGNLFNDWVVKRSDNSYLGQYAVNNGWFRMILDVPLDRTEFDTHHIKIYQNFCIILNNVKNYISRCIYDLDLSLISTSGLRYIKFSQCSGALDIGPVNDGDSIKIFPMPSSICLE